MQKNYKSKRKENDKKEMFDQLKVAVK